MKRVRERLDAEIEEIHQQLVRLSSGGPLLRPSEPAGTAPADEAVHGAEKRLMVASSPLTACAFALAGYAVATLALGRSIPSTIVLAADSEYDVGRCSAGDLDTIWAVGNLAAARGGGDELREGGPSIVIFKVESDSADARRDNGSAAEGTPDKDQTAQRILDENWDDIARVASLLIKKRTLSRAEIEAEVFEPERP